MVISWPRPWLLHLHRLHLSAVLRHISSGCGAGHQPQGNRVFLERYGSEPLANLLLGRRAQARSSVPANCALRPECTRSLPGHSLVALWRPCAAQNSASSVCASSPARTLRAAADNRLARAISISPKPYAVLSAQVD